MSSTPNVLVATDWVASHAKDANVRVVEVDVDTTAYDQGHVPGAAGWNWTTELCDTLVRDIVPVKKLEELLGKTGIDNKTTIVLYGDNNNWFAAWAFWQLKIYGHEDVRIMDGGRKKWLAEGRDLSTDKPSFAGEDLQGGRARTCRCARSCPKCSRRSPARRRALVDVRSPQEFTGEILAPPGLARNLPARRPHSRREEHSVGKELQRRRHVQELRRAEGALRRAGHHRRSSRSSPTAASASARASRGS